MKLETNFLLSKITTFELGGPAKFYLRVTSPEEAVAAILVAQDKKLKYCVVGGGSNTVFSDQGFAGLVIHFKQNKIKASDLEIKNNKVIVSASLPWADFVKTVARQGLVGIEKMAAIPGCVGGAVVGNAGAYGQEMSQVAEWVEVFDGQEIKKIKNKDCNFGYRDSIFKQKNWIVLCVGFKFRRLAFAQGFGGAKRNFNGKFN
ncbi:MAG: FAD-binding protein [Candidatus Vogelbacteria bacterium]|nr:FAD-binding protein [Candidatus Vogelbacteria bacterium]